MTAVKRNDVSHQLENEHFPFIDVATHSRGIVGPHFCAERRCVQFDHVARTGVELPQPMGQSPQLFLQIDLHSEGTCLEHFVEEVGVAGDKCFEIGRVRVSEGRVAEERRGYAGCGSAREADQVVELSRAECGPLQGGGKGLLERAAEAGGDVVGPGPNQPLSEKRVVRLHDRKDRDLGRELPRVPDSLGQFVGVSGTNEERLEFVFLQE
jgi:hypothetical protein